MPLKKDRTSYNVSVNLSQALRTKGFDTNIQVGYTYYESATELHLALMDMGDGTHRCMCNTSSFADYLDNNDQNLHRMWVKCELDIYIALFDGVTNVVNTLNDTTWSCVITRNNVDYSGSASKEVDAMAKALKNLIDAF